MKTRSTDLPVSRVMIDVVGDKTTVILWDGTYTQTDEEYEFELYQIDVPMRPGLAEAVERSFDVWYAAAAEKETSEAASAARTVRDRLLAETDYLFCEDYPISAGRKSAWADYRRALRDVPEQPGFPFVINWPAKPER